MFFTEFAEFSDKKFMTLKGLEPATQPPLVQETSFSEFTEFSESSAPFRKNSNDCMKQRNLEQFSIKITVTC